METKDLNDVHNDAQGAPIEVDKRVWVTVVQVTDTEWAIKFVAEGTLARDPSFTSKDAARTAATAAGYSVDDSMSEDLRGQ